MTNFSILTPASIALAMTEETLASVVDCLCFVLKHKAITEMGVTQVVWEATSLPVRHGIIMAWIAAEMRAQADKGTI